MERAMRINELSVALFYDSPAAGSWSLLALAEHRGVIAPDDLAPRAFSAVAGSLRCFSDRIMLFLDTGRAGELTQYVNFLLESLAALSGRDWSKEFPELSLDASFFDEAHVLAGLFQEDQTRLLLRDAGSSDASFSFLAPDGSAPETRLSPYFRNLVIDKRVWQGAAGLALDEYFRVAEERVAGANSEPLASLVNRWKKHRSVLTARL
jgi:hypothetical protein